MTWPPLTETLRDMVYRDGEQVRAGFRVADVSELAGGPIALDLFVEVSRSSRFLVVSSDRDAVSIRATFAGVPLSDPYPGYFYSGPVGVAEITPSRPWCQRLVLGEYACLEAALDLLEPGEHGSLVVTCARPLSLGRSEQEAWAAKANEASMAEAELCFELVRDDARLAALVKQLANEVRHGPPERRERPLRLLLALRAARSVEGWRELVNHPDPLVAERVRQALSSQTAPAS